MKTRTTTLTLALTAAISTAGVAYAAGGNPFTLNDLSQGYQVAQAATTAEKAKDGKCGEGKCGATKKEVKAKDGKAADAKAKDGKCGEGKCGATKKK